MKELGGNFSKDCLLLKSIENPEFELATVQNIVTKATWVLKEWDFKVDFKMTRCC